MQAFVPIGVAAGPIGAVITGVLTVVGALWGLFRGGVSGAVKTALEGLRGALWETAERLGRFAWTITHGVGWVLRALSTLWVRVLRPILDKVLTITRRLSDFIDKILKPYLDAIQRIRRTIMDLYDRFVRPVYDAIQAVRKAVAVLKILHVPFADELDRYLAKLQAKITAPIVELLRRTSDLGRWINVLITARMVLQQPIFVNSLFAYQRYVARAFWNAHATGYGAAAAAPPAPAVVELTPQQAVANALEFTRHGGGPYAERIEKAVAAYLPMVRG